MILWFRSSGEKVLCQRIGMLTKQSEAVVRLSPRRQPKWPKRKGSTMATLSSAQSKNETRSIRGYTAALKKAGVDKDDLQLLRELADLNARHVGGDRLELAAPFSSASLG